MAAPLLATRELGDLSPSRARATSHQSRFPAPATVVAVLNAIDADASAYPTVAAMVAASGYGERAFEGHVRALTGLTAQQYRNAARLDQARRLIALTDTSVADVAVRVGYDSSSGLNELFRRELGMTPADYRKQVRP